MSPKLVKFDWALKRLLRHKADFGILEGFLSELLSQDIKIEKILDSESNKETVDSKFNRVDVLCQNDQGELIIIEVQNYRQADYMQRILYGTSKAIIEHICSGEEYYTVKKVYSINIVYFDLGQGGDYVYHGSTSFKGLHNDEILQLDEYQLKLYGPKQIKDIFPEYWLLKVKNFDDSAKNTLDEWIYFLKNESLPEGASAKGLKEAEEKLSIMKLPEAERKAYEKYQEDLRYQASMFRNTWDSGKEEGLKEGEKKGRKEGLKEGEEKGLKKGQVLGILKLAEDGDISRERALEKLQAFRAELPDNEFWQNIDENLKRRN